MLDIWLAITVYPILEEVLFRGYLQAILQKKWVGRHRVSWSVSFCFSCLHLCFRGWQTALLVFFPSLLLSYMRASRLSLGWCMLWHSLANAFYFFGIAHASFIPI